MEPNTNPAPTEASKPEVAVPEAPSTSVEPTKPAEPALQPEPKPVNSSKSLIWCLAILATIGIIAAAVFAYLYFTTPTTAPSSSNNDQSSTTIDEPTTTEETEITDTLLKNDLDKKIAILFDTDNTDPTFATGAAIGYYDAELFYKGDISETKKIDSIIRHTLKMEPLDEQKVSAAITQSGFTGENESYFRQYLAEGIDGDIVADKYKEIFGKDITKIDQGSYCGRYRYNTEYNFYYYDVFGCGGATPINRFYYKNRYTITDDYAYVYVSAGAYNAEDEKIYCDTIYSETFETNPPAICGELESSEGEKFTVDENNYKDFTQYRFVFNKADNGVYCFSKVEKL